MVADEMVGRYGIDTIAVSVPLKPGVEPFRRFPLQGGGQVSDTRDGEARVEACLPKRRYGHNLLPLNQQEAIDELGKVLAELEEQLPIQVEEADGLQVSRIDIACNVRAEVDIYRYLYAVWGRLHTRKPLLLPGPHGHATQLIVKTEDWSISLYDKGAESNDDRAQDLMRVEARFQRDLLMRPPQWAGFPGPLTAVKDFTDQRMVDFHANMARWNRLGEIYRDPWDENELFAIHWDDHLLTTAYPH